MSNPSQTSKFSNLYTEVRGLEERLYDVETVKHLPEIQKENKHFKEWQVRKLSAKKLIKYLSKIKKEKYILDLGCGNGWLANKISDLENTYVIGVDVNELELEQAARVFSMKKNLLFAYANIFEPALSETKFNVVILAGVIQYFPDLTLLLDNLFLRLTDGGEIHILDSPLYNKFNVNKAKQNTLRYYNQIGFPEMASFYHHHLFSNLKHYKKTILYNPHNVINKFIRLWKDSSPFYWIKITK